MMTKKTAANTWARGYIPGDNWGMCDHCGLRFRASELREQPHGIWKGLTVCPGDYDDYNPQHEDLRAVEEKIVPDLVSPEGTITTIGTNTEDDPSAYDGSQKITGADL